MPAHGWSHVRGAGWRFVLIVMLSLSVEAMGQETATLESQVRDLVAQLDSAEYDTREAATDALMAVECPESVIHGWLASDEMTLEQRNRLLVVAQIRLITTPRGALGIRMEGHRGEPGKPYEVEITGFIEGMPAERVLRITDRITHVNSVMLTQRRDLRSAVQQFKPGEVVRLTVKRRRMTAEGRPATDAAGGPVYDAVPISLELGSVETLTEHDGGDASNSEVLRQRRTAAEALAKQYERPTPVIRFHGGS